jgi:hypothetical protein
MDKGTMEKVIGYMLLATGVATIIFTLFSVYRVFTNQTPPVQLFDFSSINIDLGRALNLPVAPDQDLSQELVESDMINHPMNIFAHLLLMGFVSTIGFKLASLGVMLLRPIKVHLKESSASTATPQTPPWK